MINTYNESNLHEKLKTIFALEFGGKCEEKVEGTKFIADVLLEDGSAIEIQTGNVSALKEKIEYFLSNKKKIKVVKPIIIEKQIEMLGTDGNEVLYRKKSPKKETAYSALRGLTGIFDKLTDENFTLVLLNVRCTEQRQKTDEKIQLMNKSRRHLKNWIPLGKKLESIEEKTILKTNDDYKKLIPKSIPQKFTHKELRSALEKEHGKESGKWEGILVWLLLKMQILREAEKRGREKQFEFSVPKADSD